MSRATHERSLADAVGARAAADPLRTAVEDGERSFTYGDLDAAASAIAAELLAAGVEAEDPVAVCLPRSWEAVAAFLGTLRAGAAYLPVNPAHPPLRQRELLELANARLALTAPEHQGGLPGELMRLDAGRLASRDPAGEVRDPPGGDRLAYVLFTSGSTGRPKGVEVTHRNLTHLLWSGAEVVPRADDCVLHAIPLDFDVAGLEIWGALLNGARIVIAPDGRPDPAELGRLIAEREVSFMVPSTGVFHELVRASLPELGRLRVVVPVGDVLSPGPVRALRQAHPGVRVINGYGPTEATILASSFEVAEPVGGPVPIGHALPGYSLYLLDEEGRPVANGEPGEIWIGGPGVARGYRGDPEQTAEHFLPNPFAPGAMYRTGDRGRRREDGAVLFLGRLDRQVKIAGQRVELGEVENALSGHPGIRETAVVAKEPVAGHKRLLAHVSPAGDPPPAPAELRAFLGERLPGW